MPLEKNHCKPASGFLCRMAAGIVLCAVMVHPLATPSLSKGQGGPKVSVAYAAVLPPAPIPGSTVPAPQNAPDAALLPGVRYVAPFDSLRKVNPEVCGWILQKDTPINHPVVKGANPTFYQTHLYTQKYDQAGAIYMDTANAETFDDRITWLYGNNREDGSMFGSLAGYMEQPYADAHPSFFLLTPSGDCQVDVFACVLDRVEQAEHWEPQQFESKIDFERYVEDLRKASAIQRAVAVQWGDRVLALCAGAPAARKDRYIVFGRLRPLSYDAAGQRIDVTKMGMDDLETVSKMVYIPGRGEMQYYAQNDPLWERMRYESATSNKARPFGQGGCAPTAVAMALANLATDQQLERLLSFTRKENGFTFCPCSVNQYFCNGRHLQYKIETAQELRRYLPVAVASFASGNNLWNQKSRGRGLGTGPNFMRRIAEACDLDFRAAGSLTDALDTLAAGGIAVATTSNRDSPFTGSGHYLVLAHADEESLYFLDGFLKEDYSRTDRRGILTVLEPGVLRVDRADARRLKLYHYYLFKRR